MPAFAPVALALLLVLPVGPPGRARLATIEATAPLQDHSEQSIQRASLEALKPAAHRAGAMVFTWVTLSQANVLEDRVTVLLFATDSEPEGEGGAGPPPRDRARGGQATGLPAGGEGSLADGRGRQPPSAGRATGEGARECRQR